MSQPGFYTDALRVWREKDRVWIERLDVNRDMGPRWLLDIDITDATQLAEMLLRLSHAGKYTADAQVHSTEE